MSLPWGNLTMDLSVFLSLSPYLSLDTSLIYEFVFFFACGMLSLHSILGRVVWLFGYRGCTIAFVSQLILILG